MSLFKYGTFGSWLLNPIGNIAELVNASNGKAAPNYVGTDVSNLGDKISGKWSQFKNWLGQMKDDFTGISAIKLQNELNRQRAEEEYQRNLDAIGDTKSAYEAAGYNPNLLYGNNPVSYEAPNLQAYSGSSKLDTMLARAGKVLSFIPAMYQATAALERIDQEREKTAQSQLRTTAMGLNLLRDSYRLDDLSLGRPYSASVDILHAKGTRNRFGLKNLLDGSFNTWNGIDDDRLGRYLDAGNKYRMGLLEAIDISNRLRNTRNNYLGYQYDLDCCFGAAGKIVGMSTQLLGGIGKIMPYKFKLK